MKFYLYTSDRACKRYKVEFKNPDTKNWNKLYFGDTNYENYLIHKNPFRKYKYEIRHRKRENWDNPFSPSFWAKNILWNYPTLRESIKDTQETYNIKIVNKIKT